MGTITVLVILKHEGESDNLRDLLIRVSGDSFRDIQDTVEKFMMQYNQWREKSRYPTLFDWFIADRQDLAEMDSQVYSYEATLHSPEDDEEE